MNLPDEEVCFVVSEDQHDQLAKGFIPINTGKPTSWDINNFSDWCKERNDARVPNVIY